MSFDVGGVSPLTCTIFGIATICVLLHSYFINKGKTKRSFVRWSTEVCASASALGAMAVIVSGIYNKNTAVTAFFYSFLYNGLFWVIAAICDLYLFWERFMVVNKKCPKWKKYGLQAYIWITVLMWAPAYSVLPFFYNTNSVSFWNVYGQFYVASGYLVLLYNLYFTVEFAFALFKVVSKAATTTATASSGRRIRTVAIKSIIHCINSSVWNVVSSYCIGIGNLLFLIFIPFGLHFLFNYKVESMFSKQKNQVQTTAGKLTAFRRSSVQSVAQQHSSHEIIIVTRQFLALPSVKLDIIPESLQKTSYG